jgi:hypothetical protein
MRTFVELIVVTSLASLLACQYTSQVQLSQVQFDVVDVQEMLASDLTATMAERDRCVTDLAIAAGRLKAETQGAKALRAKGESCKTDVDYWFSRFKSCEKVNNASPCTRSLVR